MKRRGQKSHRHLRKYAPLLVLFVIVSVIVISLYKYPLTLNTLSNSETYSVKVIANSQVSGKYIFPYVWGINNTGITGNPNTYNATDITAADKNTVKKLGIKSIRFPGGCYADIYNWRTSTATRLDNGNTNTKQITSIDDMYRLANELGAEIIYQINVSVKNKAGACSFLPNYPGKSESENFSILLQDALELVGMYKGKIKLYELGNEQWASGTAEEYKEIALKFAQSMKQVDPTIKIGIVGFPTTVIGYDQVNQANDLWTAMIHSLMNERCNQVQCFDYVTDHPYSRSGFDPMANNLAPANFPGMAAFFPLTNYDRLIFDRRLSDYNSTMLAASEWNLTNWTTGKPTPLTVENPSFEQQPVAWNFWSLPSPPHGSYGITTEEYIEGTSSLKAVLNNSNDVDEHQQIKTPVIQTVNPGNVIEVTAQVKINQPQYMYVAIQQLSDGPNKYKLIPQAYFFSTIQPNTWQNIKINGKLFADTNKIQIIFGQKKLSSDWQKNPESVVAYVDNVKVHDITTYKPQIQSVGTVEQGLFVGETLALMGTKGVYSASFHAFNFNPSPLGLMESSNTLNPAGQAFSITSLLAGSTVIPTYTQVSESFTTPKSDCFSLGCLKGDTTVPYSSTYGAKSDAGLVFLLFNRHPSKGARVSFQIEKPEEYQLSNASLKTIKATSYTDKRFQEDQVTTDLTQPVTLPPISISQIIVPKLIKAEKSGTKFDNPTSTPTPTPTTTPSDISKFGQLINESEVQELPKPSFWHSLGLSVLTIIGEIVKRFLNWLTV